MRGLYAPVLAAHVVVAILGLGSMGGVAFVASAARRAGRGIADVLPWLGQLLRVFGISLGVMLLTGVLLDVVSGGAFHGTWWFRGSVLLLVVTGALHGMARRAVRRLPVTDDDRVAVLHRIERLAYAMCVLVAAIAVLMEVKPFR